MSNDLGDRLERLAERAPDRLAADDLWERGVRRRRRQRVVAAAGAVAAVAVVVTGVGLGLTVGAPTAPEPAPADTPFSDLHVPRTVWAPDPDAPGTAETGAPGPLAVVGIGARRAPRDGLEGVDTYPAFFGVSADPRRAVWLDVATLGRLPGSAERGAEGVVLSPDGRTVALQGIAPGVERGMPGSPGPWVLYDATTGGVVPLELPEAERPGLRWVAQEPVFSDDSRWFVNSYAPRGGDESRDHALAAWDVSSGARHVLEEPGAYWLPVLGGVPEGVAWSRGTTVRLVEDPSAEAVDPEQRSLPDELVDFAVSPSGSVGYIGYDPAVRPKQRVWALHVGRTWEEATRRVVEAPTRYYLVRGWVDRDTVVVGDFRGRLAWVDVDSGEVLDRDRVRVAGEGTFPNPVLAEGLLANPLVDGVEPPAVSTSEEWLARGWPWGLGVLALVVVSGVWWRRRGRA